MSNYKVIIGLEIHAELKTKSKMFCSCPNQPDDLPNTNVCETCLAHPGTLPRPNKTAIAWTVKIAKALGCQISEESKFDRKNYFYPDLPKGYQISQYDQPIGYSGILNLDLTGTENHRPETTIGITRVHLEEDTAKLTHAEGGNSLVNFNRGGVPFVEIVSEPDVESGVEAKAYCQEIQLILRYLGVSDADMEKGQMRCEANISVQIPDSFEKKDGSLKPIGNYKLNNKVELKNINSFKAIEKGINYEIERQTALIEAGETWPQETRGWDENKGKTFSQRIKETSADYRYFPEPDIPPFNPLKIAGEFSLPELPQTRRQRFHSEYGFSYSDAYLLTAESKWGGFTEATMSDLVEWLHSLPETKQDTAEIVENKKQQLARLAGGWITSKLMGVLADKKMSISDLKVKPENFAELVALIYARRVNSTNAQKILLEMVDSDVDKDPTHIMEEKGYGQIDDEDKLNEVCDEIIKSYPKQVEEFKAGKEPIIKFLMGMVMKATEGGADPIKAEEVLRRKLESS